MLFWSTICFCLTLIPSCSTRNCHKISLCKIPFSAHKNHTMSQPKCNMALLYGSNRKGFTVVELLVTILIIGILATITILVLLSYKEKGYIVTLKSELKFAYQSSIEYHIDYPMGTATLDILKEYGFKPRKDIDINVVDGSGESLHITATHPSVTGVYQVDQDGYVSKQ